jgi:hypothetical protein
MFESASAASSVEKVLTVVLSIFVTSSSLVVGTMMPQKSIAGNWESGLNSDEVEGEVEWGARAAAQARVL